MIPFLASCILTLALLAFPRWGEAAYIFEEVFIPGATKVVVMGLADDESATGEAVDTLGRTRGWHRTADGAIHPLPLLFPKGIGPLGVVGSLAVPGQPPGNSLKGFLLAGMTLHIIEAPKPGLGRIAPRLVEVLGTFGTIAAGYYISAPSEGGEAHAFLINIATQTFTTLEIPDATGARIKAVSAGGRTIGKAAILGAQRVWVREAGGAVTFLDIPTIGTDFEPMGVTDSGAVAFNTNTQAFVWDGAAGIELIAVPGAQSTRLRGMREDKTLVGFYIGADNMEHGFIGRPAATVAPARPAPKPQETKPGPKLPQRR